jgi:hypothetical protein
MAQMNRGSMMPPNNDLRTAGRNRAAAPDQPSASQRSWGPRWLLLVALFVVNILTVGATAPLAEAEEAASGVTEEARANPSELRPQSANEDPIGDATAACVEALLGATGVPGVQLIIDVLQNTPEEGLKDAILEMQPEVVQVAWNAFVEIPICAALVAALYLNPAPVGEGDFGDVSSNFIGGWQGGITQQDPPIPPYSISVTIDRGNVGSTVASGSYFGIGAMCDFHWVLLTGGPIQMVVNEVIDSGSDCFNNVEVTLTLLGDGTTEYTFEDGNGRGSLRRT